VRFEGFPGKEKRRSSRAALFYLRKKKPGPTAVLAKLM
jgi:hypothetical protein